MIITYLYYLNEKSVGNGIVKSKIKFLIITENKKITFWQNISRSIVNMEIVRQLLDNPFVNRFTFTLH